MIVSGMNPETPGRFTSTMYEHHVAKGDTLRTIAKHYYASESLDTCLAQFNGISDPHQIYVGQLVKIPDRLYQRAPKQSDKGLVVVEPVSMREILVSRFVHHKLRELANQLSLDDFVLWISGIYGFDIPKATYAGFRTRAIQGNISQPLIELRDKSSPELSENVASYDRDTGTVYISNELLQEARNGTEGAHKLLIAITEETGHHFDRTIRVDAKVTGDGPIDEGANFAFHLLKPLCELKKREEFAEILGKNERFYVAFAELEPAINTWLSQERIRADEKRRNFSYFSAGLTVDDILIEMVGRTLRLDSPQSNHLAGKTVTVLAWDQASADVPVLVDGLPAVICKADASPAFAPTNALRYYKVGLPSKKKDWKQAQAALEQQKATTADWRNAQNRYQKRQDYWAASLASMEEELRRRDDIYKDETRALSVLMVRECMYNRFDRDISHWTTHYNKLLSPPVALDPNVPKSLFFEETRLGCSGVHLELPPYSWNDPAKNPIRSRYNLGQAIDSWAPQQYLMIKEMSPHIYASYALGDLEKERQWKGMTNSEYVSWNRGRFSAAVMDFHSHLSGGVNLMGTAAKSLFEDYTYWIRTAIRWLFQKQDDAKSSWSTAVERYNGGGAKAVGYRDRVMARVGGTESLVVTY